MASSRLPGKVLKEINGLALLQIHLQRLKKCKRISEIIVATSLQEEDDIILTKVSQWGFKVFRGSETDVLDRFFQAVRLKRPKWIVRVTSDCPLIDPVLVDQVIDFVKKSDKDYGSNTLLEEYPDGQDIEVFKFSALEAAWNNAKLLSEREHVTPFIRNNSDYKGGSLYSSINYPCDADYSKVRMTVDEIEDFELIEVLVKDLGVDRSWKEYADYILQKRLFQLNGSINRNEGLIKSMRNDK
jgi:spore coat polysaccharide biosynthesis protein SpsF (cytidylyltransferase family)